MPIQKLFVANRGEAAVRIIRAAADLGMRTVSVYSRDDETSRHRYLADVARPLSESGAPAYLNAEQLVDLARENGCDAVHPGYGFLSESAEFARLCHASNLIFVGPEPDTLELLGDKARALDFARTSGAPLARGTGGAASLEEMRTFFADLGPGAALLLKAVFGGGGRGMRLVRSARELEEAYTRASSEARASFGSGELYAEEFLSGMRHVEVQILGDGREVVHLWERECSLQRRRQKLVETAPAFGLAPAMREKLIGAALGLARGLTYKNAGTFEFLVQARAFAGGPEADQARFVFMEANPRLQVEHTVTEEATGVDLARTQLRLAAGESLEALGLLANREPTTEAPPGSALQLRVNAESMEPGGAVLPSAGTLLVFEPPGGPGTRVDSHVYAGYEVGAGFDSLVAKLILSGRGDAWGALLARARRALVEFKIEGVQTNLDLLWNLLGSPGVVNNEIHTAYVDEHLADLARGPARPLARPPTAAAHSAAASNPASPTTEPEPPPGVVAVKSPLRGRVIEARARPGDAVYRGAGVFVLESMKMEHEVRAPASGYVDRVFVEVGGEAEAGRTLLWLRVADLDEVDEARVEEKDDDHIRDDLREVLDRHAVLYDAARPRALEKRHKRGQRSARENIADLLDPGSFQEYGGLALAAQRGRRSLEELIKLSPADGLVAGIGTVGAERFAEGGRCAVMSYDYTVFAGTQGLMNHKKTDRLLGVVRKLRLPLVVFTEGGGGRPGDTDVAAVAGLDLHTFRAYAGLSGLVPRIAVVSGRCFAGNAALAGMSDLIIAVRDASMGMGGPVMIKGGGFGNVRAEDVGPALMHAQSGVVDLLVDDEPGAVDAARRALSYFQGSVRDYRFEDQRKLRRGVPENRLRAYDVRAVIRNLADVDSVLELGAEFAPGLITAFIRVNGRALGLIANNPVHLAGAITAACADKASRFLRLCDGFKLPILSLIDTPGIMVGPEAEKEGLVRSASNLFLAGAALRVPMFTIVLRKGYGLGAMAMAGGSFHAPVFTVAWPTGEFGAMGLEGAVETGYARELAAVKDWDERKKLFDEYVARAYAQGKAINMASYLEIDDVIDPAESRNWIARGLAALPPSGEKDM